MGGSQEWKELNMDKSNHNDVAVKCTGLRKTFGEGAAAVQALRGIDLEVRAGELMMLVGPSGCGKTTLVKVLIGLLDRTDGTLTANGRDVRDWDRAALRSRLGVVLADDQLFVGTIEDNISFFDPKHDPARVRACARAAMIDRDIEAMPMQYNTMVGSLAHALSAGQKQRILLARALYRGPQILFLDEAFDQLDLALESRVTDQLRRLTLGVVIVSHRPETIRQVDRIVRLAGDISELSRKTGPQA